MRPDPAAKYRPFQPIDLPDRRWPKQTIKRPPIWLSTDLRDGNQALIEPMDAERKLSLFLSLVKIWFK
jgi:2-isopropylmalate synthase